APPPLPSRRVTSAATAGSGSIAITSPGFRRSSSLKASTTGLMSPATRALQTAPARCRTSSSVIRAPPSEGEALHQVADLPHPVARRGRRAGAGPRRGGLVVAADGRRRVEAVVDRRQRRQAEVALEELEDRGELVEGRLDVPWLGPRRDHPCGHPDS